MNVVNLENLIHKKLNHQNKRKWELAVAYPALEALGYLILRAGDYVLGTRIIVGFKRNRETWFIYGLEKK
jgi:hypothetical protein